MTIEIDRNENEVDEKEQAEIRERILHLLTVYPVISPTMLQGGIGAYIKTKTWRPILEDLIATGEVTRKFESATTPTGRYSTYTKLSLPETVANGTR